MRPLARWGVAGGVVFVYMTDWKLILDKIPFVKGRFRSDQ